MLSPLEANACEAMLDFTSVLYGETRLLSVARPFNVAASSWLMGVVYQGIDGALAAKHPGKQGMQQIGHNPGDKKAACLQSRNNKSAISAQDNRNNDNGDERKIQ